MQYTWVGTSWRTAASGRRAPLRAVDAAVPGAVAIHTCARDAWLCDDPRALVDALGACGFSAEELDVRTGAASVERLLSVACGLDSAVQGEGDVGRQVRAALGRSGVGGVLDHVLARLLRLGRREGWVREGDGVARLAARVLPGGGTVGIVGAGALGQQVAGLLRSATIYNRSPGTGANPLKTMVPHDTWIVATSAAAAWFQPPEPFGLLIDLGHPAQALDDPRRISLDVLLDRADARLAPSVLAHAHAAVRLATADVLARLHRRDRSQRECA